MALSPGSESKAKVTFKVPECNSERSKQTKKRAKKLPPRKKKSTFDIYARTSFDEILRNSPGAAYVSYRSDAEQNMDKNNNFLFLVKKKAIITYSVNNTNYDIDISRLEKLWKLPHTKPTSEVCTDGEMGEKSTLQAKDVHGQGVKYNENVEQDQKAESVTPMELDIESSDYEMTEDEDNAEMDLVAKEDEVNDAMHVDIEYSDLSECGLSENEVQSDLDTCVSEEKMEIPKINKGR